MMQAATGVPWFDSQQMIRDWNKKWKDEMAMKKQHEALLHSYGGHTPNSTVMSEAYSKNSSRNGSIYSTGEGMEPPGSLDVDTGGSGGYQAVHARERVAVNNSGVRIQDQDQDQDQDQSVEVRPVESASPRRVSSSPGNPLGLY